MQTAIDWLMDQYKKDDGKFLTGVYEQAKEKEKEQIIDFGYKCRESKNTLPQDIFNSTYNLNK